MSEIVSNKAVQTWLQIWQELAANYPEFEVALRLLNTGVRYRENKGDRRVLLELAVEERKLLEDVLNINKPRQLSEGEREKLNRIPILFEQLENFIYPLSLPLLLFIMQSNLEQHDKLTCEVESTLKVIGGRWKVLIIRELMTDVKRFGELQRALAGITQKMLTQQLRELEDDGIIHREVYPQIPPKVEYSLTPLGQTLKPLLYAMHEWGVKYSVFNSQKV